MQQHAQTQLDRNNQSMQSDQGSNKRQRTNSNLNEPGMGSFGQISNTLPQPLIIQNIKQPKQEAQTIDEKSRYYNSISYPINTVETLVLLVWDR